MMSFTSRGFTCATNSKRLLTELVVEMLSEESMQ
jgi:hypothetical protein